MHRNTYFLLIIIMIACNHRCNLDCWLRVSCLHTTFEWNVKTCFQDHALNQKHWLLVVTLVQSLIAGVVCVLRSHIYPCLLAVLLSHCMLRTAFKNKNAMIACMLQRCLLLTCSYVLNVPSLHIYMWWSWFMR